MSELIHHYWSIIQDLADAHGGRDISNPTLDSKIRLTLKASVSIQIDECELFGEWFFSTPKRAHMFASCNRMTSVLSKLLDETGYLIIIGDSEDS